MCFRDSDSAVGFSNFANDKVSQGISISLRIHSILQTNSVTCLKLGAVIFTAFPRIVRVARGNHTRNLSGTTVKNYAKKSSPCI